METPYDVQIRDALTQRRTWLEQELAKTENMLSMIGTASQQTPRAPKRQTAKRETAKRETAKRPPAKRETPTSEQGISDALLDRTLNYVRSAAPNAVLSREAAEALKVSQSTAGKALKLLRERKLLRGPEERDAAGQTAYAPGKGRRPLYDANVNGSEAPAQAEQVEQTGQVEQTQQVEQVEPSGQAEQQLSQGPAAPLTTG